MKIKEVSINEIHWCIQKWNEGKQASDKLKELLQDSARYFASCNVGHAYYQWNTNITGNWTSLIKATPQQRELVEQRMEAIRQEVVAKMPGDYALAEQLLEVPTMDYIFFKTTPDGNVDVVITGWGFRNFKKDPPFRFKVPKKQPARPNTIAFAIDNEPLPNRAFTLKAPWTTRPDQKTTGPDGLFTIEEPAGTTFEIVDTETGKAFTVTIDNDTPSHVLDITEKTSLTVQAFGDGQPLEGEPVSVHYAGQQHNLVLQGGQASIPYLTLQPGHSCQVIVRGQEQNVELTAEGPNVVTFQFETPVPEVHYGSITAEAYADGYPISGELASFDYCGQHFDLPLVDGVATLQNVVINPGEHCYVTVRELQLSAEAQQDQNVLLRFDFQTPPPEPLTARLAVLDHMGVPFRGSQCQLTQGQVFINETLDDQGQLFFLKDAFALGQPIAVNVTTPDQQQLPPAELVLDAEENDYVLQLNAQKKPSRLLEILMAILLLIVLILLLIFGYDMGLRELINLFK